MVWLFGQGAAVLYGFVDVRQFDIGAAGQVGDGTRHAQDAVVGAARPFEALHALPEFAFAGAVEFAVVVDLARREVLVAFALALQLPVGRRLHTRGNHGGGVAAGRRGQYFGCDRGHLHLDIDAVQQRTGHAVLVAQPHIGRAAAGHAEVAEIAARGLFCRNTELGHRSVVADTPYY